ncbi:galactokinase [Corynebacterium sp. HMSC071F07]|uniref:galactokinase n=1 Tax=Corynebacterium sp. HMSC071F07 TaxID=1715203 RepID=UPI0008A13C45|nr:galactokinase [Corynebacterium sp. HMSC071F07]OFL99958.1 galactokinase [Corynebacterium sp. HMSC071F07]
MLNWISTRSDAALADAATALFRSNFDAAPAGVWAAPGRVNLIGEHVDYAGGASIPFALEQNTAVAVAPRSDGLVRIASEFGGQVRRVDVFLDEVGPGWANGTPDAWAGYVVGSLWAGLEDGSISSCTGLDIAIVSDVPVGSGLSSSAALECSVAVAAYELSTGHAPDDAARTRLVLACMRAENEVVGASTGGLDQNASLFGEKGKALVLDFSTGEVRRVPFNIAERDMVLLIADTNAPHSLNDGQYASRRGVIDAVQSALAGSEARGGTIRDIPDAVADATRWAREVGEDEGVVKRRVAHVVEETARTLEAASDLEAGNLDRFRELMRDSHISLRDQYEVTTPELDCAFVAAGEVGARMTGGGFGGAVIVLVKRADVESTAEAIAAAAAERGFPAPTFLVASPGDGARRIAG